MKCLLIFLFTFCLLTDVRAESNYQDEPWISPDGKIAIKETKFRGPVIFVDIATQKTIYSFSPNFRNLTILWSPDSSWVVIDGQLSRLRGFTHVFYVSDIKVTPITLPNELNDDESPMSLLPSEQRPEISHSYGAGNEIQQWLKDGQLLLRRLGGGNIKNKDGSCDEFSVTFEFLIQCNSDGSSKLLKTRFVETKRELQKVAQPHLK